MSLLSVVSASVRCSEQVSESWLRAEANLGENNRRTDLKKTSEVQSRASFAGVLLRNDDSCSSEQAIFASSSIAARVPSQVKQRALNEIML